MSTLIPGVSGPAGASKVNSPAPQPSSDAPRTTFSARPASTQAVEPTGPVSRSNDVQPATSSRQTAAASAPISQSLTPALSTYQDQSSGRLVIKVFDKSSGQVLAEFPPERALQYYPELKTTAPGEQNQSVEVDV